MNRRFAIVLAAVVAVGGFAGLVHLVLVVGDVSEPAAVTVYGLTTRRLWASAADALALFGVAIGVLAMVRPVSRFGAASGPLGAVTAMALGLTAAINGGMNVAMANGGPGTGNGVVGGAAAFVLGLAGALIGWIALVRGRRIAVRRERTT